MLKRLSAWLEERRRRREWGAERQLEWVRTLVMMDHRWLGHDKTADALTSRYLLALDKFWHKQSTEDVRDLRERLGLCPHKARHEAAAALAPSTDTAQEVQNHG